MNNEEKLDYKLIRSQLENGKVIPFLGAAASRISTPSPPTALKLAELLLEDTDFPKKESCDLATAAQYLKSVGGPGLLYDKLHGVFNTDYSVSSLHDYLAEVARNTPLLIITTNYDDLIERAFTEVEHDTVVHICNPKLGGKVFWATRRQDENGELSTSEPEIALPNKLYIDLSTTTVIYKMHGTVDRRKSERDQYVIAEDDYIDFLTRMTKNSAIPKIVQKDFSKRHFLFLGYSLRDWNFRVVLNRIKTDSKDYSQYESWAIQHQPSPAERRFWARRGVSVYDIDLNEFIEN